MNALVMEARNVMHLQYGVDGDRRRLKNLA